MIKRTYGAHPFMILSIMKPFLFVLILPVVKGVIQYLTTRQMTGILTLEIFAAAAVFIVSFLGFRSFTVSIDNDKMIINKGFLFKTVAVIKRERLSCVSWGRSVFDLALGSVTYKVNTEAGASGKTDFSFKLRAGDAKEMSAFLYGEENRKAVRFNALKSAIFAAATSSAITGLLVGVPIINNLGKILGVALSAILFDEINHASSRFDAYFPPIVNVITVTLVVGYLLSFVISFVKMLGFRLRIGKDKAEVEYGVIARYHTLFKKGAVNDICVEQTPLMRFFGMFSMRAAVGGYGDKRGEKAIIVPAARHKEIENQFKEYFSFLYPQERKLKPEQTKRNIIRFLWLARLYAMIDIGITAALSAVFPSVWRFLLLAGIALMVIIVYYGTLCLKCYKSGGLVLGDRVSGVGFKGLTARELYCEKYKVGEIKIIETPADRLCGTCKAEVIVRSESADSIKVLNINRAQALLQMEKTFCISE